MGNKEDINRIERVLIEQEHRPIKVITNYLSRKTLWPDDVEKQKSTKKAILWRLFFSPGVVAAVGGVMAIISLILLIWQNNILLNQNNLIKEQNLWFQQQIRSSEISSLKELLLKAELEPLQMSQVFVDYVSAQKELDSISNRNRNLVISGIDLSGAEFTDQSNVFSNITFNNVNFSGANFTNINFNGSTFIDCNFDSGKNFNEELVYSNDIFNFNITLFKDCNFKTAEFVNKNSGFGNLFINCKFRSIKKEKTFYYSTFIECTEGGNLRKNHEAFFEGKHNNNLFYENSSIVSDRLFNRYSVGYDEAIDFVYNSPYLIKNIGKGTVSEKVEEIMKLGKEQSAIERQRDTELLRIYERKIEDLGDYKWIGFRHRYNVKDTLPGLNNLINSYYQRMDESKLYLMHSSICKRLLN